MILKEAYNEYESHVMKVEEDKRRQTILTRWKKLLRGLLLKDRLDREYGDQDNDDAERFGLGTEGRRTTRRRGTILFVPTILE